MLRRAKSLSAAFAAADAQQIQFHYDVSDDFYALWLDPRRVYSCAYFREPGMSLAQAQEAKLDHICRKLMLRPGERFLDIGAGWGGLLLWAAEHYGVNATGITLSKNQHAHVQRLIEEKGLQGRVRMLLRDYRDLRRRRASTRSRRSACSSTSARPTCRPTSARSTPAQARRPGDEPRHHGGQRAATSWAPAWATSSTSTSSPAASCCTSARCCARRRSAGLEMVDTENLRPHYARTLWAWSDALEAQLDEARAGAGDAPAARRGQGAARLSPVPSGCAMSFEQGWIGCTRCWPRGRTAGPKRRAARRTIDCTPSTATTSTPDALQCSKVQGGGRRPDHAGAERPPRAGDHRQGRRPEGIIEPASRCPVRWQRWKAAIAKEEPTSRRPSTRPRPTARCRRRRDVSLRQRAVPFIDMLKRCQAEAGKEIVWGV
jgi:cyclopropane-fatty-acyl-phospholipid synthase